MKEHKASADQNLGCGHMIRTVHEFQMPGNLILYDKCPKAPKKKKKSEKKTA